MVEFFIVLCALSLRSRFAFYSSFFLYSLPEGFSLLSKIELFFLLRFPGEFLLLSKIKLCFSFCFALVSWGLLAPEQN